MAEIETIVGVPTAAEFCRQAREIFSPGACADGEGDGDRAAECKGVLGMLRAAESISTVSGNYARIGRLFGMASELCPTADLERLAGLRDSSLDAYRAAGLVIESGRLKIGRGSKSAKPK